MQLELIFSHESRFLPGIAAFTRETLKQWPHEAGVATKLGDCVVAAQDRDRSFCRPTAAKL